MQRDDGLCVPFSGVLYRLLCFRAGWPIRGYAVLFMLKSHFHNGCEKLNRLTTMATRNAKKNHYPLYTLYNLSLGDLMYFWCHANPISSISVSVC